MRAEPPVDALRAFLAGLARQGYVVLKNTDVWATLRRGGDWDLLVADVEQAEHLLVELLGRPARLGNRSYVRAYFFPWGEIDLLPRLEWRGVELVERGSVLSAAAAGADGALAPRPAHEAVASWIAPLLFSGTWKPRYGPVVAAAVADDAAELGRALRSIAGATWGRRLEELAASGEPAEATRWTRRLRLAVRRQALRRSPAATAIRTFELARAEARLRLDPPLPVLAVTSVAQVRAAADWARQCPVANGVVLDRPDRGDPVLAVSDAELDALDELSRDHPASGIRHRPGPRRLAMAKEQARGRLILRHDGGGTGKGRMRRSSLFDDPTPAGPPDEIAALLDAELTEHVRRNLLRT